ncbi:hypothetical protein HDV05_000556 [Chytridiales sp. JEL 0842]|nr:hypothetical protein HDV05_000556 [Chytridiales sp. JEL 0842]
MLETGFDDLTPLQRFLRRLHSESNPSPQNLDHLLAEPETMLNLLEDYHSLSSSTSDLNLENTPFSPLSDDVTYESLLSLTEQLGPAKPLGASKEQIEGIPTKILQPSDLGLCPSSKEKGSKADIQSSQTACAICMDEYNPGDEVMDLQKTCCLQFAVRWDLFKE